MSGIPGDPGHIDVGGGASVLVDRLLDLGYSNLAVLDVSSAALNSSRVRLGARAAAVEWFEVDVTAFAPPHRLSLWHDRAAFQCLTDTADRASCVATFCKTLEPGGEFSLQEVRREARVTPGKAKQPFRYFGFE